MFEGCLGTRLIFCRPLASFSVSCLLGTGRERLHSGRAIPAGVLFANVWDATRGAESHVIEEEGADGEAGGEVFFFSRERAINSVHIEMLFSRRRVWYLFDFCCDPGLHRPIYRGSSESSLVRISLGSKASEAVFKSVWFDGRKARRAHSVGSLLLIL